MARGLVQAASCGSCSVKDVPILPAVSPTAVSRRSTRCAVHVKHPTSKASQQANVGQGSGSQGLNFQAGRSEPPAMHM